MRTEAFTTADIHFLVNQAIVAGMRRTRSIGDYMTPTNLDDAKDEFLSRSVLTPNFQYRKIDFDPIEEELALRRVLVPIGVWPELSVYQDKVRDHLTTSAIVTSRGDVDKLKELNKELFGNPTERTLAYAQQVLKTFPDHMAIPETVNPEEIVRGLKEELEKYGLSEEKPVLNDLGGEDFIVTFDPLDGSSIIGTNWTVGSIFGIWPNDERKLIKTKVQE